jgi:hypothetical protein
VLVLGEGTTPLITNASTDSRTDADLVLMAPSRTEARRQGWIRRAAADAEGALAPDGLVYALLPRGRRRAAARALRDAGLVLETAVAQLAEGGEPRYFVPLASEPWRHAMTSQISARPLARRVLAWLGSSSPGRTLLGAALPAVGLVARRPGAAPMAGWVAELEGEVRQVATAILATSWREPGVPLVLSCFAPGEPQPWGVAKLGPYSLAEIRHLQEFGEVAGLAGVRAPSLLAAGNAGAWPVLVQTVVPGRPAADVLARSPGHFDELVETLCVWLERWNRATATTARGLDVLEAELLRPATELREEWGAALPDGYGDWLAARVDRMAGAPLPVVARHNDLTMWNVRLDGDAGIGVLDWAEADMGLPLTDFFYAVADAAAACDRYRDRVAALQSGLGRIAPLRERLQASLGLSDEVVELCFHSCWLRHALNEHRMRGDGQFVEIARWAARQALGECA